MEFGEWFARFMIACWEKRPDLILSAQQVRRNEEIDYNVSADNARYGDDRRRHSVLVVVNQDPSRIGEYLAMLMTESEKTANIDELSEAMGWRG